MISWVTSFCKRDCRPFRAGPTRTRRVWCRRPHKSGAPGLVPAPRDETHRHLCCPGAGKPGEAAGKHRGIDRHAWRSSILGFGATDTFLHAGSKINQTMTTPSPPTPSTPAPPELTQSAAGEEDPGSSLDIAPRSPKARVPVAGADSCPKCMGLGKLASGTCPDCHGSGNRTALRS